MFYHFVFFFFFQAEDGIRDIGVTGVQTCALPISGFASLHVALTLVIALVAQATVRHAVVRWAAWVYFGLTLISTLYFGWHYVADDIAGAAIAYLAVWLGALATGNRFGPFTEIGRASCRG